MKERGKTKKQITKHMILWRANYKLENPNYKNDPKAYSKLNDKEYRDFNKVNIAKKRNATLRKKLKKDKLFKLKCSIRTSMYDAFENKGYKKPQKTEDILGCSFDEFKKYLESLFEPWMNWNNKGKYNKTLGYGWDIDHIIPLCEAKSIEDVIKLSHYTNLQPLCSRINRDIKRNNLQ